MDEHRDKGVAVRDRAGLRGVEFEFLNGTFHLKVSGEDTNGGVCIYDTWRHQPGGPPLHVHEAQNEWFFVTEGEFDIRIGNDIHHLAAGDSVLGPVGIPHCFRNTTPTGRLMVMFQPAGTMEAFFTEGAALGPLTPQTFAALSGRHGMRVVGPPLG